MKSYTKLLLGIIILHTINTQMTTAQPLVSFKVPIVVSTSIDSRVDSMWCGVHGDGTCPTCYEPDNSYGFDVDPIFGPFRETIAPPDPQTFDWLCRWREVPGRSAWGAIRLYPNDFRGYSGTGQIDTFCLQIYGDGISSAVGSAQVTLRWPANICNYGNWTLKKKIGVNYSMVLSSMCSTTSWTDDNTAGSNDVRYLIIRSTGEPPCTAINFNRIDISFGSIMRGSSSSQTITVCNPCPFDILTISSITLPPQFSISPTSATLPPGACATFTLSVTPTTTGAYSGTIIFNTNRGNSSIPVSYDAYTPTTPPPNQFKVKLTFTGTLNVDSVWMGVSGDGPGGTILDNTNGFDGGSEYGAYGQWREMIAPPPGASGAYARFMDIPGSTIISEGTQGNGLHRYDFRGKSGSTQVDTFAIQMRTMNPAPPPGPLSVGPLTISWPSDLILYGNRWELKKKIGDAYSTIVANMETGGTSCVDPNTEEAISIEYLVIRYSISNSLQAELKTGWNMVSVPVYHSNTQANDLFPGKFGSMFGFNSSTASYEDAPLLSSGHGYWAYFTSPTTITFSGDAGNSFQVACHAGWNLIGSRNAAVSVTSLTIDNGSTIFGDIYRYDSASGTYQPTLTVSPCEAVWVYVTGDGILTLP